MIPDASDEDASGNSRSLILARAGNTGRTLPTDWFLAPGDTLFMRRINHLPTRKNGNFPSTSAGSITEGGALFVLVLRLGRDGSQCEKGGGQK